MRKIVMVFIKESKTLLYMGIKRNKYIIVSMRICIFLFIFVQVVWKIFFFYNFFLAWGEYMLSLAHVQKSEESV